MPIVPLHVNVYLPPQPTPARCYAWGAALGEILRNLAQIGYWSQRETWPLVGYAGPLLTAPLERGSR